MIWIKRIALTIGLSAAIYAGSMAAPAEPAEANYLYTSQCEQALRGQRAESDNDIKILWDRIERNHGVDIVSSSVGAFYRWPHNPNHEMKAAVSYMAAHTPYVYTVREFSCALLHGRDFIQDWER